MVDTKPIMDMNGTFHSFIGETKNTSKNEKRSLTGMSTKKRKLQPTKRSATKMMCRLDSTYIIIAGCCGCCWFCCSCGCSCICCCCCSCCGGRGRRGGAGCCCCGSGSCCSCTKPGPMPQLASTVLYLSDESTDGSYSQLVTGTGRRDDGDGSLQCKCVS